MDSLSSVILPPTTNPLRHHRRRRIAVLSHPRHRHRLSSLSSFLTLPCPPPQPQPSSSKKFGGIVCKSGAGGVDEEDGDGYRSDEMERALHLDGTIPGTPDEFVKRVSSRAYDMRRNLHQTFDSSSYDVLEANPWRETSKPVYVLTHTENQLCTMKTRRNRSEVERELGLLFSKGGKWRSGIGNQANKQSEPSGAGTKFQMLVEDISDGVLVFEDENEAAKYCDLLQGGSQDCEGIAEIDASSVFDLCRKMKGLAVLFRRGRTHPLPESLKLNLRARKRSLEDQEGLM